MNLNPLNVVAGDWVAFFRDARIVYARTEYVRQQENYPHKVQAFTTSGVVNAEDVLEVRKCP